MINKSKSSIFLVWIAIIGVTLGLKSCASSSGSPVSTAYHNTTSHYNGYWYARENINAIENQINESVENDYDKILPLFPEVDTTLAKSYSELTDEAIKMASLAIQHHPNSKWEDDSYLLVGLARLYSLDYVNAITTFKYVNINSDNFNTQHSALVYLMKAFTDYGELSNAVAVSDYLKKEPLNAENMKLLYLHRAYYYQLKGDLDNMLTSLVNAAPMLDRKDGRGRIYFIIGQNYQELGFEAEAYNYYRKCIGTNPEYELDFHARLKMAQVTQLGNNSDVKAARKLFRKLLDDKKNKEFRDKIYYEMAEFEMRNKNLDLAVQYYNSSVRESVSNNRQKGLSYLKLGRIYYDTLRDFRTAKAYYDSTLTALPQNHEEYEAVSIRQGVLADFVNQLTTIEVQDSLLELTKMDTATLRDFLRNYVEEEQEKAKAEEERNRKRVTTSRQSSIFDTGDNTASSSWYFGSQTAVAIGQTEFKRVWGDIELTDNWRRSVKESIGIQETADGLPDVGGTPTGGPAEVVTDISAEVEKYFQTVPYGEERKQEALDKIEDAYYRLGNLYYFDLKESTNAAGSFETLLERFSESEYSVEVMYLLYLIYNEQSDSRADLYRLTILNEHENSIYAKLILNPNYSEESSAAAEQLKLLYEEAYGYYSRDDLANAERVINQALSEFDDLKISARFKLLQVLIIGKKEDITKYQYELSQFIKNNPDSEFTPYAETLLTASREFQERMLKAQGVKFIEFFEQEHFLIIAHQSSRRLANTLTAVIEEFNSTYYADKTPRLTASNLILDDDTNISMVREFTGPKSSLQYYEKFILDPRVGEQLPLQELEIFTITKDNFTIFYQTKELKGYLAFFKNHY